MRKRSDRIRKRKIRTKKEINIESKILDSNQTDHRDLFRERDQRSDRCRKISKKDNTF